MDSNSYNNLTYRQTEAYHDELRQAVYDSIEEHYKQAGISSGEISYNDVLEANVGRGFGIRKNELLVGAGDGFIVSTIVVVEQGGLILH